MIRPTRGITRPHTQRCAHVHARTRNRCDAILTDLTHGAVCATHHPDAIAARAAQRTLATHRAAERMALRDTLHYAGMRLLRAALRLTPDQQAALAPAMRAALTDYTHAVDAARTITSHRRIV